MHPSHNIGVGRSARSGGTTHHMWPPVVANTSIGTLPYIFMGGPGSEAPRKLSDFEQNFSINHGFGDYFPKIVPNIGEAKPYSPTPMHKGCNY